MKNHFSLFLIILFIHNFSVAQFNKIISKMGSLDVIYSQKFYQNNFGDQFIRVNSLQNYDFSKSSNYFGFGILGTVFYGGKSKVYTKHPNTGSSSFSIMIPRDITVSDTIQGKIIGFNVGLTVIGIDLLYKYENVDILLYAGFNTGRLRMYGNQEIRQKNPYFSPKLSLCPRVKIGNFALSLNLEYDYDVSKTGWRRTMFAPKGMMNIQNFKQSGLTSSITVGFLFPRDSDSSDQTSEGEDGY